jgi:cytochrome c551/c552
MKRKLICGTAFVLALTAYGCGSKPAANQEASPPPAEPAATAASDSVSIYDAGPRAGESPVDEALARQGEQLFQQKGCTACHGFGKKVRGPDLDGVTMRRTAKWMEEQMLHPEIMTKQDPIARALFAQYSLQMTNLGLTEAQARSLVEFLKRNDRKIGAAPKP